MKDLSTENKVAIIAITVTLVIVLVVLIMTGTLTDIFKKYKKQSSISCTSTDVVDKINYKDIKCVVRDDYNKTYSLSYPEFNVNEVNLSQVNNLFKNHYKKSLENIEYYEYEKNNKIGIYAFSEMNYKIIFYSDFMFIFDISNIVLDNEYRYDYKYDIIIYNLKNKNRITQAEFIETIKLHDDFSSNLKKTVFNIYSEKFNYNYDYATKRNENIDKSYERITLSNINTFYYDANGKVSFILYLYDLSKFKEVPYFFKVDNSGKITYSEFFS